MWEAESVSVHIPTLNNITSYILLIVELHIMRVPLHVNHGEMFVEKIRKCPLFSSCIPSVRMSPRVPSNNWLFRTAHIHLTCMDRRGWLRATMCICDWGFRCLEVFLFLWFGKSIISCLDKSWWGSVDIFILLAPCLPMLLSHPLQASWVVWWQWEGPRSLTKPCTSAQCYFRFFIPLNSSWLHTWPVSAV